MLTFAQAIEDIGPVAMARIFYKRSADFFSILRIMKDGGGNPNHDDLGRFSSGEGGSGGNQSEKAPEPRIVSSSKMQTAVLRNTWAAHGADLDYDDVWGTDEGEEQWVEEVESWNDEHGTSMDPDKMDMDLAGPNAEFLAHFEGKYLEGNKAPFPGANAANEYFANSEQVHLTAFTSTSSAEKFLNEIGADYTLRKATETRKDKAMDFLSVLKGNPHRADLGRYSSAKGAAMHAHPEGTLVRHKETGRLHLVQGHTDDGRVATTGGQYKKEELEGGLLIKINPNHDEKGQFASGEGGGSGGDKTVSGYSSKLTALTLDNDKFDALASQLKDDKSIKQPEMREIAVNYIGYHIAPSTSRTNSWQKIVDTQMVTARQTARASMIKSQPGAADVHATTALGNDKKRKAKDFRSTIAETKGIAKGNEDQPRDDHGRFAGGGGGSDAKPESPHEGKSGQFEHAGSADLKAQGFSPKSRGSGDSMHEAALVAWQHAKNTGATATAQPGGRGWRVVGPGQKLSYGSSHITVSPEGKLHSYSYTLGKSQSDAREVEWQADIKITKMDEDQQLVFGWASVTHIDGELVIDKQGDIISSEELEKAAYDFVLYCREQGDMHERRGVGKLVESCVFTQEKMAKCGLYAFDPESNEQMFGWFCGFKTQDAGVWKRIKSGHLPEFSVGGRAIRVPVGEAA